MKFTFIRLLVVGLALVFSHLASADIMPRPQRREEPRCACFRAPCDCERYERDADRYRTRPLAYSNCVGGDFSYTEIGNRGICAYSDVNCLAIRNGNTREYSNVLVQTFCAASNGVCPSSRDLTDCANSDDVSTSEAKAVMRKAEKACATMATAPSTTAPARRNQ